MTRDSDTLESVGSIIARLPDKPTSAPISEEVETDVLVTVTDSDPLIHEDTVDATCIRIDGPKFFRKAWGAKLVFNFRVFEPQGYEGEVVRMFVAFDERWQRTYFPESSDLYKAACTARGGRLKRGERITKQMFYNRAYRLKLRQVSTQPASYTIVDHILEKLTS